MSSREGAWVVLPKRQQCPSQDPHSCSNPPGSSTPGNAGTPIVFTQTPSSTTPSNGSTDATFTQSTPTSNGFTDATSTLSTPSLTPSNGSTDTTSTQSSTPSPIVAAVSSTVPDAGTIAGSVIGGVIFLVLVVLGVLLYLRARKRRRTPPSSEFMNSLRAGATPVLRLDSGAEYAPTLPEKGGGYTHYTPVVPLPFMQNSYYTSPPMLNMKFPDEMMMTDIPSGRPSVEKPLHPQRFSSQQHRPSTSIGSRRELWGSETEILSDELSPVSQSPPRTDSVLHFAPRFSLDGPSPTHSPTSLQPLRRQPDPEGTEHL